ncbi:MAG: hypothetical protein ACRD1H_19320 [Vicinamibacterales bacterium]
MDGEPIDPRWRALTDEVLLGMRAWRAAHPQATLRELEAALDERWASARAALLADIAVASTEAHFAQAPPSARPRCPDCGTPLVARGQQTRTVLTHGGQPIPLTRDYARCPACGTGVFPPR